MGLRLTPKAAPGGEIWARNLSDGSMAVALFNRGDTVHAKCEHWNVTMVDTTTVVEYKCASWDSVEAMKNSAVKLRIAMNFPSRMMARHQCPVV